MTGMEVRHSADHGGRGEVLPEESAEQLRRAAAVEQGGVVPQGRGDQLHGRLAAGSVRRQERPPDPIRHLGAQRRGEEGARQVTVPGDPSWASLGVSKLQVMAWTGRAHTTSANRNTPLPIRISGPPGQRAGCGGSVLQAAADYVGAGAQPVDSISGPG